MTVQAGESGPCMPRWRSAAIRVLVIGGFTRTHSLSLSAALVKKLTQHLQILHLQAEGTHSSELDGLLRRRNKMTNGERYGRAHQLIVINRNDTDVVKEKVWVCSPAVFICLIVSQVYRGGIHQGK